MRFLLLFTAVVVVFCILQSCANTRASVKAFEKAKVNGPYDCVIVPGAPYGDSAFHVIFLARIAWAKYLVEKGLTKHVIFSGAAVSTPYLEGMVMKIIADSNGIPAGLTFAETKAEHSTENAYYGWKLAKQLGFKKIALATDPFQASSLKNFIRKRCDNIAPLPIVFKWLPGGPKRNFNLLLHINPRDAFVEDFVPLKAREDFFERFRGTQGKHIHFD